MSSYRRIDNKVSRVNFVERYELEKHNIYTGYIITLENDSSIKILIEDETQCCEKYGSVLLSPLYDTKKEIYGDDYKVFLDLKNSVIHSIKWGKKIDDKYIEQAQTNNLYSYNDKYDEYSQHYFVNIYTNRGMFQVVLFNYHDGYYKHNIYVEWGDYIDTDNTL